MSADRLESGERPLGEVMREALEREQKRQEIERAQADMARKLAAALLGLAPAKRGRGNPGKSPDKRVHVDRYKAVELARSSGLVPPETSDYKAFHSAREYFHEKQEQLRAAGLDEATIQRLATGAFTPYVLEGSLRRSLSEGKKAIRRLAARGS